MANLNIVLLGKTGHGKSSSGNTILRENFLHVSTATTSYTKMIERGTKKIGKYKIQVFDTPGPFDTDYMDEATGTTDIARLSPLMDSMIAAGDKDGGVHAFFLVLTSGTRLTDEEMTSIKILEDIFGSDVFHEFGVLVFTRGDELDEDFSVWCAKQDDKFKKFMAKFMNRSVVTINKGEFSGRRLQCSENMIKAAADLNNLKKAYTSHNHKLSEKSRTILFVNSKKDVMTSEFLEKINTLREEISKHTRIDAAKAIFFFRKINELRGEIKNASKETDVLDDLYEHIDKLETLLQREKQKCSVM